MTKEAVEILSAVGASGIIVVLMFYFWVKKIITKDIVDPAIEPLRKEIKELRDELNKKDDKLERISGLIEKNSETLNEMKSFFNLIKGKIEVRFKE